MQKLDKTDLRILETLISDARTSYADLARETNLTIPSIKTRIDKYVETGLIDKFTIILDENILMKGTSMTFLLKVKPAHLDKVAKEIYENSFIANMSITSGHYNLVIVTHNMKDNDKLELIKKINSLPSESVMELASSINIETFMCKPVELPKAPINLEIRCDYCHREFIGEIFSKAILGRKRYFCSPVCQEKYNERAEKYIKGDLFQHPDELEPTSPKKGKELTTTKDGKKSNIIDASLEDEET